MSAIKGVRVLDRLRESQALRQAALDHIRLNPGIVGPNVARALGWANHQTCNSRLRGMVDIGDLRRVETHYKINGRAQKTYKYWALRDETLSAEEINAVAKTSRTKAQIETCAARDYLTAAVPTTPLNVPRYKHEPGALSGGMAIPNQGGQGYAAPRMGTYLEVAV